MREGKREEGKEGREGGGVREKDREREREIRTETWNGRWNYIRGCQVDQTYPENIIDKQAYKQQCGDFEAWKPDKGNEGYTQAHPKSWREIEGLY